MKDKIRQIVYEEYSNTLGIVAYKDNKKVYEEFSFDFSLNAVIIAIGNCTDINAP